MTPAEIYNGRYSGSLSSLSGRPPSAYRGGYSSDPRDNHVSVWKAFRPATYGTTKDLCAMIRRIASPDFVRQIMSSVTTNTQSALYVPLKVENSEFRFSIVGHDLQQLLILERLKGLTDENLAASIIFELSGDVFDNFVAQHFASLVIGTTDQKVRDALIDLSRDYLSAVNFALEPEFAITASLIANELPLRVGTGAIVAAIRNTTDPVLKDMVSILA